MGSITSYVPGPQMCCYYASKAFIHYFMRGLALEVNNSPVKVTGVEPGATWTGFGKRAGTEEALFF